MAILALRQVFHVRGVMISVVASSAVVLDSKDYNIAICSFSTKHAALRRKSKDWLARNPDNVSDISMRGLLIQWANTTKK